MSTGTGLNVSKANIVSPVAPSTGLGVSKALAESTVVGSIQGSHVSKANAYSSLYGSILGIHVSKANVYSVLIAPPLEPVVVIDGHFIDNQGNPLAKGYLEFNLSSDALPLDNSSLMVTSLETITIPLDSNGDVVTSPQYTLWPNNTFNPPGTYYTLKAFTAQGELVYGPEYGHIYNFTNPFSLDNFPED